MYNQEHARIHQRFCEVRIKMLQAAMKYNEPHPADYMTLHDFWCAWRTESITEGEFVEVLDRFYVKWLDSKLYHSGRFQTIERMLKD